MILPLQNDNVITYSTSHIKKVLWKLFLLITCNEKAFKLSSFNLKTFFYWEKDTITLSIYWWGSWGFMWFYHLSTMIWLARSTQRLNQAFWLQNVDYWFCIVGFLTILTLYMEKNKYIFLDEHRVLGRMPGL